MKSAIKVEITLSGGDDTFNLPQPCTCCGASVSAGAVPWERKITYNLVKYYWNMKLGEYILKNRVIDGVIQTGSVTLRAPYCERHQKNVKFFKYLPTAIYAISYLAAFLLIILTDFPWDSFPRFTGTWFDILLPFIGLILLAFAVAIYAVKLINGMILLFRPDLKDYPTEGNGHWGLLPQDVRNEIAEPGTCQCRYILPVAFANRESAQRFVSTYPQVIIVKNVH